VPTSWFRISSVENAFRRSLGATAADFDRIRIAGALDQIVRFFKNARAQHTRLDHAEDTLRMSWAPDEAGLTVTFSRRMQRTGNDVPLVSLDLTLRYVADAEDADTMPGEIVVTNPEQISHFVAAARASTLYRDLVRRRPDSVTLSIVEGPR